MLILLILAPLVWILRFKDYRFGFVSVVSGIISLNAAVSVGLQTVSLFKFSYLLAIHSLVTILSLGFNYKLVIQSIKNLRKFNFKKIPWTILCALFIITLQFYFVHFNYSGEIITYSGVSKVENFNSKQPYFSDEWITVGMSEKSIETSKLPFVNFMDGSKFTNFLFFFQSLVSGVDLLLDLNLLVAYKSLAIVFSLVLISFIYVLLRNFKISIGISIFTLFLISYLPNSSNLPLLWYLLPWNVGFLFLISYFIAVQKQYFKTAILFNILSISFYPPIVLLAIPSFLTLYFEIKEKNERVKLFGLYLGTIFIGIISTSLLISIINKSNPIKFFSMAYDFIFRPLNSSLGQAPLFIIWEVLPWFIVPFVFLGLWKIRREFKYVSITIFIGVIMWFLYGLKMETFLMDYHRVVAVTSILLLVSTSFGLEQINSYFKFVKVKNLVLVLMLSIFFILSFSFTSIENWKNFTSLGFRPAPPANKYLTDEDVKLFSGFTNEKFLAPPWKGLTLAVVTNNIPVISKPSTLTVNLIDYNSFIKSECVIKKSLTNKFKIKYVYTPEFKCEGFELVGTSAEGLSLYLVK
ncbi:MAG: hypothetical protein KBD10_00295 [Candidatus Pacebacteria bacterium]|nr:hypothetical protein [Candidatus Paceibacterota bacterium]